MGREKRVGDDRLSPTTVQVSIGELNRIDELGHHRSTFIRQAIKEKLERDTGFDKAIELQNAIVDKLLEQTEHEQEKLRELHEKRKAWMAEREVSRVRDIVIAEIVTGHHRSKESLRDALRIQTQADLDSIIIDVWKEFNNE